MASLSWCPLPSVRNDGEHCDGVDTEDWLLAGQLHHILHHSGKRLPHSLCHPTTGHVLHTRTKLQDHTHTGQELLDGQPRVVTGEEGVEVVEGLHPIPPSDTVLLCCLQKTGTINLHTGRSEKIKGRGIHNRGGAFVLGQWEGLDNTTGRENNIRRGGMMMGESIQGESNQGAIKD